jgi:hypothetical protein
VPQQYDIFRKRFGGSFVWLEAVEGLPQVRKRLSSLFSSEPADHRVWDSSVQEFINPLEECA